MIPGMNLLGKALSVIAPQSVRYFKDAGRTTTATGRNVTAFEPGVDITNGSLQSVPRARYESMGLDYSRSYRSWFVPRNVIGVERDQSGDEFEFDGRRYKVESVTPWFVQDGWNEVLGIDIGAAAP